MGYGHGGILIEEEFCDRLAHDVAASHDHGVLAGNLRTGAPDELDNPLRGARLDAGIPQPERAHVQDMEGIHILGLVYGINDLGLVNMLGERQLHEYSVHGGILVQGIDMSEKLGFACALRQFHEARIHTHVRGRLHLVADVHLARRVLAHDYHGKRRLAPETLFEHLHPGLHGLLHGLGNGLAVDDAASAVLQCPVGYVPAIEEIVALDLFNLRIHPVCRFGNAAAFADQHHHPSASGDELSVPEGSAHMVDFRLHGLASLDGRTLVVSSRIAPGCEHHAHSHGLFPLQRLRLAGKRYGLEHIVDVALQKRQDNFGLRIPETGVEFYDLYSLRRLHKAAVEHSAQRTALLAHCGSCSLHYLFVCVVPVVSFYEREPGVGTHTSGIRALVAVEGTLVVLGKRHRIYLLSIHEAHEGELGSGEEVLDHYPALAETFVEQHHLQSLLSLPEVGGNHHSLACGETVIFEHCRERTG